MDNNIEEIKQNEAEQPVSSNSWQSKFKKFEAIVRGVDRKTAIIAAVIVVVGVVGYMYKGIFVAAMVNGSPISRLAVINKLEVVSGKEALDSLITQKLILAELDKNKITTTNDEVSADIKKIEDQITAQGGTLTKALVAQGMTLADLESQISINSRMEKLLADKIQVTDAEISQYILDNKIVVPKGEEAAYNEQARNQLKSDKLDQAAQSWVDAIRAKASIKYFVSY